MGESARDLLVLKNLQQAPGALDYVTRINMVHISPWRSALGLLEGAGRLLRSGGPLILDGPLLKEAVPAAQSNLDFHADLRRRDPELGFRRVENFAAAAEQRRFDLVECYPMPANNMMLLFRRR